MLKSGILQRQLVLDVEVLHQWQMKSGKFEDISKDIYYDWDRRRILHTLPDQEKMVEKQCVMLRMMNALAKSQEDGIRNVDIWPFFRKTLGKQQG